MATTQTAPAPTPTPSITEQANAELAAAKTGHDPLKPLRYAVTFVGGTLRDGINGMGKWGRTGLKYGAALGILTAIGAPWLLGGAVATVTVVALGGFALGMLGGGTYGLANGGMRAVNRMNRAEKYAEDLIVRDKQQRSAPINRADYRHYTAARRIEAFETQRQFLERQKEIERDARTYSAHPPQTTWQDRIAESRNHHHDIGI